MGKLTRKELEDLEDSVELVRSQLRDVNFTLFTFGRVLTALLQDRLATLPEAPKFPIQAAEQPVGARSLFRSVDEFKPQPERCGGKLGKPNLRTLTTAFRPGLHQIWHQSSDSCLAIRDICTPCPGCPDCEAKSWHLQAAEAIWEVQRQRALRQVDNDIAETAALILKYAPKSPGQ